MQITRVPMVKRHLQQSGVIGSAIFVGSFKGKSWFTRYVLQWYVDIDLLLLFKINVKKDIQTLESEDILYFYFLLHINYYIYLIKVCHNMLKSVSSMLYW